MQGVGVAWAKSSHALMSFTGDTNGSAPKRFELSLEWGFEVLGAGFRSPHAWPHVLHFDWH